jgi:hypothetical protein
VEPSPKSRFSADHQSFGKAGAATVEFIFLGAVVSSRQDAATADMTPKVFEALTQHIFTFQPPFYAQFLRAFPLIYDLRRVERLCDHLRDSSEVFIDIFLSSAIYSTSIFCTLALVTFSRPRGAHKTKP